MSFAGLEGFTGVDGAGEGEGERWGRRVCDAMAGIMADV